MKDGRDGEDASRFIRHQDACRQYGVSLDKQQYLAGREQGLQQYCQLDNAITLGLKGIHYQSAVCPTGLDKKFRYYNDVAYQSYRNKEDLKSLDSSLVDREKILQDKKLPDGVRQNIRNEIRDLDRKRQQLRDDLYGRERQLDRLMEELRYVH